MDTISKGQLGSLIAELKFVKNGFNIFKPCTENGKVDMIIEKNNIYLKCQIKTVQKDKKGNETIPVRKIKSNRTENKIYLYDSTMIDYFIGVDVDTNDVYILPIEFSSGYKSSISVKTVQNFKNNFDLNEINI